MPTLWDLPGGYTGAAALVRHPGSIWQISLTRTSPRGRDHLRVYLEIYPEDLMDGWAGPSSDYRHRDQDYQLRRLYPGSWWRDDDALMVPCLSCHPGEASRPHLVELAIHPVTAREWIETIMAGEQVRYQEKLRERPDYYLHYRSHQHTYSYRGSRVAVCCVIIQATVSPYPETDSLVGEMLRESVDGRPEMSNQDLEVTLYLRPEALRGVVEMHQTHGVTESMLDDLGLWETEWVYHDGRPWLVQEREVDEDDTETEYWPIDQENLYSLLRRCYLYSGDH